MKHKALFLGSVLLGSSVAFTPVQAHHASDVLLPLTITGLLLMDSHSHHGHSHHYHGGHGKHYAGPRHNSYGRSYGHTSRHHNVRRDKHGHSGVRHDRPRHSNVKRNKHRNHDGRGTKHR